MPGGACRQEARHSSFRNPTSTIRQISSQRKKKWGYKVQSLLKSFFQGILSGLRTPHRAQVSIPGQLESHSFWMENITWAPPRAPSLFFSEQDFSVLPAAAAEGVYIRGSLTPSPSRGPSFMQHLCIQRTLACPLSK